MTWRVLTVIKIAPVTVRLIKINYSDFERLLPLTDITFWFRIGNAYLARLFPIQQLSANKKINFSRIFILFIVIFHAVTDALKL